MTSPDGPSPASFAEVATRIEVLEQGMDALRAGLEGEAVVMRLRLVNAVSGVSARLKAELREGLEP